LLRSRIISLTCASVHVIRLSLPATRADLATLAAGDEVLLSGPAFTARDAGHARLLGVLNETGELPFGLAGQVLFYAGPTPPAAGRPFGAVGPTTASRMDAATPRLLEAGIVGTIGKGARSETVAEACRRTGSIYFAAVGGAAALLARHVVAAEPVAWEDLGTEALQRLMLREFPAFVAIDAHGRDLYRAAAAAWREEAER
jgi:tartrate/fumarate subfamily iron-sulfur-dependent hydro-lyase beta chain